MGVKQTSIAKGTLIITVSVLLSRILGLGRNWLLAYVGGTSIEVDAYNFAFLIPNLLNHFLASGYLSITLVPLILPLFKEGKTDEASKVFSNIFFLINGLMIIFSLVCWAFAEQLLPYMSHKPMSPEVLELAVRYTRIILFGQVFFVAGGLFIGVQHATYNYFLPALSPLIYNISIIVGGLFSLNGNGLEGFCWGVLAGAALGSGILQYFGTRKTGIKLSLRLDIKDPVFIKYITLSLPFVIAAGMTFSNEFVYLFFGMDDKNSVAILGYALRIAMVIVGVFGMAISVASYPHMARLCSESKYRAVNALAAGTLEKVFALLIPSVIVLSVFAEPVIDLVYNYGKFDAVTETAHALKYYLIAALPMSAQLLVVRPFYADSRTWLPSIITLFLFAASLPFYLLVPESVGIVKIPLISALLSLSQFVLIFVAWLLIHPDRVYFGSLKTLLKVTPLALGLYYASTVMMHNFVGTATSKMDLFFKTSVSGIALMALFFVLCVLFKIAPVVELKDRISGRFVK